MGGGGGGKLQSHGGERSHRGAEGKVERLPHRGSVPSSTQQPERLVCSPARREWQDIFKVMKARREWQDIFKVMKGKNLQPRLLYPARISFRFDGEIKTFTDKQKLREFSTTKPALQQRLKELL